MAGNFKFIIFAYYILKWFSNSLASSKHILLIKKWTVCIINFWLMPLRYMFESTSSNYIRKTFCLRKYRLDLHHEHHNSEVLSYQPKGLGNWVDVLPFKFEFNMDFWIINIVYGIKKLIITLYMNPFPNYSINQNGYLLIVDV